MKNLYNGGYTMKKAIASAFGVLALTALATSSYAATKGADLFKEKCASCHPDGGNIVNAQKTLKKKELAKNKLNGVADIVKYMRKPGPGMPAFDDKALPEKDAKAIAEYIIKTFK
jgi:cytochrome c6